MKKAFFFIGALFTCAFIFAQAPQMFNYQAVVRNASGELITSQQVSFRISILEGTNTGTSVYTETHNNVDVNASGLVSLAIGSGSSGDDFTAVDWSSNNYFAKIEVDVANGTAYQEVGVSQLLSVPYALHALTVENELWTKSGDDIVFTSGNVGIGTASPETDLEVNGTTKIGANGEWISEIREIVDTTHATNNYVVISLPSGYSISSARVLNVSIEYSNLSTNYSAGLGYVGTNGTVGYKLSYSNLLKAEKVDNTGFVPIKISTNILVYYPDELKNKVVRILLMKKSTPMD